MEDDPTLEKVDRKRAEKKILGNQNESPKQFLEDEAKTEPRVPGVDEGWAWLTLLGLFFSGLFNGSLTYSSAIFHVALLKTFNHDVAYTAFIGSVFTSLLYLTGPVASIIIKKTSCRFTHCLGGIFLFLGFCLSFFAQNVNHLLFTYGILGGLGTGFVATAYSVVVVYRFKKYLGIAVGLQMTGAGLSLLVSGPIIQALLDTYGLRGSFLILGAAGSHQIVWGLLMKPSILELESKIKQTVSGDVTEKEKRSPKSADITDRVKNYCSKCIDFNFVLGMLKNPSLVLMFISTFVWHIPASILQLHLPNYAVSKGSTEVKAALLLTMIGIGSTIGRVIAGILLGKVECRPVTLELFMLGVIGIFTVLFPLYSYSYAGQGIYSVVYGLFTGGLITIFGPICFSFVSMADIPATVGTRYFIGGLAYIAGPPFAGLIVDNGGTYEHSFYLSGALFILGGLIDIRSSRFKRSEPNETSESVDYIGSLQSFHSRLSLDSLQIRKVVNNEQESLKPLTVA